MRKAGSGNVGATNVTRVAGPFAGILTLVLDAAKGSAAVWLAAHFSRQAAAWMILAGIAALIGHCFPVWLRFHGGKGVATATGAFLALDPLVVAAAVIVFLLVLITTRFVSLASILSAASIPIFFHFLARDAPFWRVMLSIPIAIAVIVKHHSNIRRLVRGEERRMGESK